jgi:hypothetical protein
MIFFVSINKTRLPHPSLYLAYPTHGRHVEWMEKKIYDTQNTYSSEISIRIVSSLSYPSQNSTKYHSSRPTNSQPTAPKKNLCVCSRILVLEFQCERHEGGGGEERKEEENTEIFVCVSDDYIGDMMSVHDHARMKFSLMGTQHCTPY